MVIWNYRSVFYSNCMFYFIFDTTTQPSCTGRACPLACKVSLSQDQQNQHYKTDCKTWVSGYLFVKSTRCCSMCPCSSCAILRWWLPSLHCYQPTSSYKWLKKSPTWLNAFCTWSCKWPSKKGFSIPPYVCMLMGLSQDFIPKLKNHLLGQLLGHDFEGATWR